MRRTAFCVVTNATMRIAPEQDGQTWTSISNTRRNSSAPGAAERHQELGAARLAAHAGEAVLQEAAVEEARGRAAGRRAQRAVRALEALLMLALQTIEVIGQHAVERRVLGPARRVGAGACGGAGALHAPRGLSGSVPVPRAEVGTGHRGLGSRWDCQRWRQFGSGGGSGRTGALLPRRRRTLRNSGRPVPTHPILRSCSTTIPMLPRGRNDAATGRCARIGWAMSLVTISAPRRPRRSGSR